MATVTFKNYISFAIYKLFTRNDLDFVEVNYD